MFLKCIFTFLKNYILKLGCNHLTYSVWQYLWVQLLLNLCIIILLNLISHFMLDNLYFLECFMIWNEIKHLLGLFDIHEFIVTLQDDLHSILINFFDYFALQIFILLSN